MSSRRKPSTRARSHADGLTLPQQSAADLLAAGKTDTEAAAALGLSRVTVTRWRLYDVRFAAELAERRAHVWGAAADKLRSLVPAALDVLAHDLNGATGAVRRKAALAVLKLAGPLPVAPAGSTDPEDYVRAAVQTERDRMRSNLDAVCDRLGGMPDYDDHLRGVRDDLARRAAGDGADDPETPPQGDGAVAGG